MKNLLRGLSAILVLTAMTIDVDAAERTFTWTNPTLYEDGTTIEPGDLASFDFGCKRVITDEYVIVETFSASTPLQTSRTVELPPGDHWCAMRVSTTEETSAWSNEVFFTLPYPVPRPPTDLGVGS